jgi:endo-alpha-1,4-polygalactosaminidase (GH114 family)
VLYDPGKENSANRLYEKAMLDNCKNGGKPVVLIEYVTGTSDVSDVKTTCASWGYGYYIANPNLNLSGVDTEGWTGIEG